MSEQKKPTPGELADNLRVLSGLVEQASLVSSIIDQEEDCALLNAAAAELERLADVELVAWGLANEHIIAAGFSNPERYIWMILGDELNPVEFGPNNDIRNLPILSSAARAALLKAREAANG